MPKLKNKKEELPLVTAFEIEDWRGRRNRKKNLPIYISFAVSVGVLTYEIATMQNIVALLASAIVFAASVIAVSNL